MSIIALQTAMFVSFGGGEMLQKYLNEIKFSNYFFFGGVFF